MQRRRALLAAGTMIPGSFATLPHPFKYNDNKAADRQRGRNHPPWGRVVLPSLPLG